MKSEYQPERISNPHSYSICKMCFPPNFLQSNFCQLLCKWDEYIVLFGVNTGGKLANI